MLELQNIKIFWLKDTLRTGKKKFLLLEKLKLQLRGIYIISDLNGEETAGSNYEKELQKTNQEKFRIEKGIKRKDNRFYVNWEGCDNSFNSWIN